MVKIMNFDQKVDLAYEVARGETTDKAEDIMTIIDNAHRYYHNGQSKTAHKMLDKVING